MTVRARVCRRHSKLQTPNRHHLQVLCLCNGATMQLRLIGQGCGCSMVRGEGGLMTVSARLCRRHSKQALAGWCRRHLKQAPPAGVLPLQRSRYVDELAAAPRFEAEADS